LERTQLWPAENISTHLISSITNIYGSIEQNEIGIVISHAHTYVKLMKS
jgi:hypothetical protein